MPISEGTDDPGWRLAWRLLPRYLGRWYWIPISIPERVPEGLSHLRAYHLALALWMVLPLGLVEVLTVPHYEQNGSLLPPLLAVSVAGLAAGTLVIFLRNRPKLDQFKTVNRYRSSTIRRFAAVLVPGLLGWSLSTMVESTMPMLLGLAISVFLYRFSAPTARDIEIWQRQIDKEGRNISLRDQLMRVGVEGLVSRERLYGRSSR